MDAELTVADLKRRLVQEVRVLFRRNGSVWKEPILDVVHELRQSRVKALMHPLILQGVR